MVERVVPNALSRFALTSAPWGQDAPPFSEVRLRELTKPGRGGRAQAVGLLPRRCPFATHHMRRADDTPGRGRTRCRGLRQRHAPAPAAPPFRALDAATGRV